MEDIFFDKLEDDLFLDAYSMKDHAQRNHLLASKWGIGNVKQELWRSHSIFLQRIIDNVPFHSHGWAVGELKVYFGGDEDLSKSENKAAKRIIREATKPQHAMNMAQASSWPPPQQFMMPPMMEMGMGAPPMMGMGMGMVPSFFLPLNACSKMQPAPGRAGSFTGMCFNCNQTGHKPRNCTSFTRQNQRNSRGKKPYRKGKRG